jgi:hypothetical protein
VDRASCLVVPAAADFTLAARGARSGSEPRSVAGDSCVPAGQALTFRLKFVLLRFSPSGICVLGARPLVLLK